MKTPRLPILAACCATALSFSGHAAPPEPDTRAADEAALRAADAACSDAARTADGILACYAADAAVLAPNEPMSMDEASRRKIWTDLFAMPGFSVRWKSSKVEVARSGDLGYTLGTYELSMNDADGKAIQDHGKYASVWRKQDDGSWKLIVDMFNTDMPLPMAK